MRKYLEDFMTECEYPRDAICELLLAYDRLSETCDEELCALISEYESGYDIDYIAALDSMRGLCEQADVHEYTGALLLFLCYTRPLRRYYREAGIADSIFFASMLDLKYKLDECRCVYGINGSFVAKWFAGFFKLERFALGRLQYEIIPFGTEYEKDGIRLAPDSRVLNVHIPRTGTPLDETSLLESYRLAGEFYRDELGDDIAFVCSSWLLFPRHLVMLSEHSNIRRFISDYDIIASGEYASYAEVWRLFDVMYNGNADDLPADTSLRRAYVDLIRKGEKTGWGRGLFIPKD